MKPKLEQEIWHIFNEFGDDKRLRKMTVGYIGKKRFICYEQINSLAFPIWFRDYGTTWFLTEEEALEWLERNDYEWNEYVRAYIKKGEEEEDE